MAAGANIKKKVSELLIMNYTPAKSKTALKMAM